MIAPRAALARSEAATMGHIAAAGVVEAWVALAAAVSEVEVEAFEEGVAGANGTLGRFRAKVTFRVRRPQAQNGEMSGTSLILMRLRPVLFETQQHFAWRERSFDTICN